MTFAQWLATKINEDTPTGDLARDVKWDDDAPIDSSERRRWHLHLMAMTASQEAYDALDEAFDDYEATK